MEYRYPIHNASGSFDCEINHPDFGWIPFTASADDSEEYSRNLFTVLVGEIGMPDEAMAPTPEELRAHLPIITARQLRLSLLSRLDEVEALITASNDRALQIEWEYATTFERLHPAIVSIGAALDLTEEEIDTMWLHAANT